MITAQGTFKCALVYNNSLHCTKNYIIQWYCPWASKLVCTRRYALWCYAEGGLGQILQFWAPFMSNTIIIFRCLGQSWVEKNLSVIITQVIFFPLSTSLETLAHSGSYFLLYNCQTACNKKHLCLLQQKLLLILVLIFQCKTCLFPSQAMVGYTCTCLLVLPHLLMARGRGGGGLSDLFPDTPE